MTDFLHFRNIWGHAVRCVEGVTHTDDGILSCLTPLVYPKDCFTQPLPLQAVGLSDCALMSGSGVGTLREVRNRDAQPVLAFRSPQCFIMKHFCQPSASHVDGTHPHSHLLRSPIASDRTGLIVCPSILLSTHTPVLFLTHFKVNYRHPFVSPC